MNPNLTRSREIERSHYALICICPLSSLSCKHVVLCKQTNTNMLCLSVCGSKHRKNPASSKVPMCEISRMLTHEDIIRPRDNVSFHRGLRMRIAGWEQPSTWLDSPHFKNAHKLLVSFGQLVPAFINAFFVYNFISILPDLGLRVGPKTCRLNKWTTCQLETE